MLDGVGVRLAIGSFTGNSRAFFCHVFRRNSFLFLLVFQVFPFVYYRTFYLSNI